MRVPAGRVAADAVHGQDAAVEPLWSRARQGRSLDRSHHHRARLSAVFPIRCRDRGPDHRHRSPSSFVHLCVYYLAPLPLLHLQAQEGGVLCKMRRVAQDWAACRRRSAHRRRDPLGVVHRGAVQGHRRRHQEPAPARPRPGPRCRDDRAAHSRAAAHLGRGRQHPGRRRCGQ
eukprot:Amastigsp_a509000_818.p3 type:complete len:173 gc:universal Amastigsp_a509000_818:100-618(+)